MQMHKSQTTGIISQQTDGAVSKEILDKILPFSRRGLSPEEVFVFPVVLCDNDIDRDGERFTEECLKELAPLMKGRTGICDHNPKAANQVARLYDCHVERADNRQTAIGTPLWRLIGNAYMLRTPKNEEQIAAIEGGICKEVSISCAVSKQTCSVCGRDARTCNHLKGRMYGDKRCYVELGDPTDGYEWSFVAIPAQRNAGITKGRKAVSELEEKETLFKAISQGNLTDCPDEVLLTEQEAKRLSEQVAELKELAVLGKQYEDGLRQETLRLGKLAGMDLSEDMATRICGKLNSEELNALKKLFESFCKKTFPMEPQTAAKAAESCKTSLDGYRI